MSAAAHKRAGDWQLGRLARGITARVSTDGEFLEHWVAENRLAAQLDAPDYMPAGSTIGCIPRFTLPYGRVFTRGVEYVPFETNHLIYTPPEN